MKEHVWHIDTQKYILGVYEMAHYILVNFVNSKMGDSSTIRCTVRISNREC
jgi:hypothetical protein